MKNLFSIFVTVLTIVLCAAITSCKNDDDNSNNSITGVWAVQSYFEDGSYHDAMQFNSDGSGCWYNDYYGDLSSKETFSYIFDKKTLVWTWDDENVLPESKTEIWTVISFSEEKIVFSTDYGPEILVRLK